jgi:hypothetical protein
MPALRCPPGDIHKFRGTNMCWLSVTPSGDGEFSLLISSNSSRGWVTQGIISSATNDILAASSCWHSGAHRRYPQFRGTNMCWLSVTPSGDGGFPLLISSNSSRGWVTQGDTSSATTRRIRQELFFSESDKSYFFSSFTSKHNPTSIYDPLIYLYLARYLRLLLRGWVMKPDGITLTVLDS